MIPGNTVNAFPDKEVKKKFPFLPFGRYSFCVVSGSRYQPRSSKENKLSMTIARKVSGIYHDSWNSAK